MDITLVQALRDSYWIRSPWTWDRIITEAEYLDWLARLVPCCACGGRTGVHAVTVTRPITRFHWAPLCDPCDWLFRSQGAAKLKARILGPRAGNMSGLEYLEHQRTEHGAALAFERLPVVLGATGWGGVTRRRLTDWALREGMYQELLRALAPAFTDQPEVAR